MIYGMGVMGLILFPEPNISPLVLQKTPNFALFTGAIFRCFIRTQHFSF